MPVTSYTDKFKCSNQNLSGLNRPDGDGDGNWSGASRKVQKRQGYQSGIKSTEYGKYFTLQAGESFDQRLSSDSSFIRIFRSDDTLTRIENDGSVAGDDPFDINTLLKQIKEKGVTNSLLSKFNLEGMTVTEFYQLVEGFIKDVEETGDTEAPEPLSPGRKVIYTTVLLLTCVGASSSVLGLLSLGADGTARERTIGMIQFTLALLFSHGVPNGNAMHNLMSRLDNLLTDYFRRAGGPLSSVWSDIKQGVRNLRWQTAVPTTLAFLIAGFAPLQTALNSREGGINLVSRGDPSLMGAGAVVGNFLMFWNWLGGSALLGSMASSLFAGYADDIKLLIHGASSERNDVERLVQTLRKMMIASVVNPDRSGKTVPMQSIASSEVSEDKVLLQELLNSTDSVFERVPDLKRLLEDINGSLDETLARIKLTLEGQEGEAVAGLGAGLVTELSDMLKSLKLCGKVRKQLCGGDGVEYSDFLTRLVAGVRLTFRFAVVTVAGSCIAVNVATPMVTNYYKAYMEDPTQPVDCLELQNITGGIESFGDKFTVGLVSYLLRGISLSDAFIKMIGVTMTPFILLSTMFMSDRDLESVRLCCKALIRDFPKAASVCGLICAAVVGSIYSSAGNKFDEYLELRDCDIGVPDTFLAWAAHSVPAITIMLMVTIRFHLGVTSFGSVFRKLRFGCSSAASEAATRKTDAEEQRAMTEDLHVAEMAPLAGIDDGGNQLA